MEYTNCPILFELKKKKTPLISKVPCDEFTDIIQNNFDYEFTGESKFYPYELPKDIFNIQFNILAIVGASGSGKSTLLKEFITNNKSYHYNTKTYELNKAIVSNFSSADEASTKLSAVGLNSIPVWCRPRNVLSVG